MPPSDFRLVLDTNVVVRAFVNLRSDSGRILRACENRRMVPLLSRNVLDEYRYVLRDTSLLGRYPQLERPEVAIALERLRYVGEMYRRVGVRFAFSRDPKDAHLIELAIAGRATHLISTDQDLLSLPRSRSDDGKRFRQRLPRIEVMTPSDFVKRHADDLPPV